MAAPFLYRLWVGASVMLVPFFSPKAAEETTVTKKSLRAGEPSKIELERARKLLDQWENDEPKGTRPMRIVYWSPADREPQPEFRRPYRAKYARFAGTA